MRTPSQWNIKKYHQLVKKSRVKCTCVCCQLIAGSNAKVKSLQQDTEETTNTEKSPTTRYDVK